MEVKCKNDGLLTDIEVYDHINDFCNDKSLKSSLDQCHYIQKQTVKYLLKTLIEKKKITSDKTKKILSKIKQLNLGLTEAELLQIANLIPVLEVEVHLVIEECAERLSSDDIESILKIIREAVNCDS